MAIGFKIPGKTLLKQSTDTVGMSDAADFITVRERIFNLNIFSNESGPNVPAKIINHGRLCEIRAPLTQFDRAILDPLMKASGATTLGQIGSLGADITPVSWSVVPAITGATSYTFPKCFFVDAVDVGGWGLQEQKIVIVLWAIPDPAALSTATTAYYTTATV